MIEQSFRYAHLAGSLVLFGAALFPFYVGDGAADARRRLQLWCARAALLGAAAATALHAASLDAPPVIAQTSFGQVWFTQAALLLVLSLRNWSSAATAILAGTQLALFALVGHAHAIAGLGGATWQSVHLLAAGGWSGGLASLWLALREAPSRDLAARFSRAGYVFVALLTVSAFAVLHTNTGAWLPPIATQYGVFAALKIALFAGALLLALFNRMFAAPRGAWLLLTRIAAAELALIALLAAIGLCLARQMPYG